MKAYRLLINPNVDVERLVSLVKELEEGGFITPNNTIVYDDEREAEFVEILDKHLLDA